MHQCINQSINQISRARSSERPGHRGNWPRQRLHIGRPCSLLFQGAAAHAHDFRLAPLELRQHTRHLPQLGRLHGCERARLEEKHMNHAVLVMLESAAAAASAASLAGYNWRLLCSEHTWQKNTPQQVVSKYLCSLSWPALVLTSASGRRVPTS